MHTPEAMTQAGCTTLRGLRFWEEKGLLGNVARSAGGTRQYTDEQIRRAKIIAAAKFGGFELETIEEMLDAYDGDASVYEALMMRLLDQARAAIRLQEQLPKPLTLTAAQEYDL